MTTPSARLPARDFEEIRLAEALERGRCPICDARPEATHAALRGLAREGATDRGFRKTLDDGVGFCQPHSVGLSKMELLQTSSQLATAVLLEAVLKRRLASLKKLLGSGGTGQARGIAEIAPARCPVCAGAAEAGATAASRLLELSADASWAASLERSEICLQDLYHLWAEAATSSQAIQIRWNWIAEKQLARLEAVRATLAEYAHNSTSDRRHMITREQHEAGAAALRPFGRSPDRGRGGPRLPFACARPPRTATGRVSRPGRDRPRSASKLSNPGVQPLRPFDPS